jgi:thiol:disulfide interchange protein DsbD
METVKSVFGVALLAAAAIFLSRAIPGARSVFSAAQGAAWIAAAVAGAGVLVGALHASFHGPTRERVLKGAGVALTVVGAVYAIGSGDARSAAATPVAWEHDEAAALARARAEGKPVIIDFWADWCVACKELDRDAWADPAVQAAASRFVKLKIDATEESPVVEAIWEKYGIVGMPTVLFIDSSGRELPSETRVQSSISGREMLKRLEAVDSLCAVATCVTRW